MVVANSKFYYIGVHGYHGYISVREHFILSFMINGI